MTDDLLALSDEEKRAIRRLKRAVANWPRTLWLFTGGAGDSMSILKIGPDGERMYINGGGVDPDYVVDHVSVPNDGGDW